MKQGGDFEDFYAANYGKTRVSVPQSFSSRHVIDASSNEGDVVVAPSP